MPREAVESDLTGLLTLYTNLKDKPVPIIEERV